MSALPRDPSFDSTLHMLSDMGPAGARSLARTVEREWRARLATWEGKRRVVLVRELREILCRAVCSWAGVPLTEREASRRAREFGAMYEGAGAVGPRNWWGMLLRTRTERWARALVRGIRAGRVSAPPGSAAHVIAMHRDLKGRQLPPAHAAVELINVLRPTAAVERYVTFAAHALHEHAESVERIRAGDEAYLARFVREVRRFYPFFPMVGGRALREFEWRGRRFSKRTWVLLDLYVTDHDPRRWARPDEFLPDRFLEHDTTPFDLIPQGGGDHRVNHRCAGEGITIELVKTVLRLLATEMRYEVPAQDLRIEMRRMPAVPRSRVVLSGVTRPH